MREEFSRIEDHIGNELEVIVGIGPGVAGLEVLLSRHCDSQQGHEPTIILIDKTGVDPIHFGFHQEAAAYNSLELSRSALIMNGHSPDAVLGIDADDANGLRQNYSGKVGLITSLIAWGFHFPVETYLELTLSLLKEGGRLIIDVRKGTTGRSVLEQSFQDVSCIHEDEKFERLLAIKAK